MCRDRFRFVSVPAPRVCGVFLLRAVSILSLVSAASFAQSPAPKTVGFMGALTSASGVRLNGPVSVTLSLYNVATGGTALWSENQSVQTANGLFSTALGSVTPFPPALDFSKAYFVGVKVQGDTQELLPRIPLQGAPYALFAHGVADNSITSGKLASDAASLNRVSGGAATSAYGNVTIGPAEPAGGRLHVLVRPPVRETVTAQNPTSGFISITNSHWQSFTIEQSGLLTKVVVGAEAPFNGVFSLYAGEGADGAPLLQQNISFTQYSDGLTIPLIWAMPVTSGQVYTWRVDAVNVAHPRFFYGDSDVYRFGRADLNPAYDYRFTAYISEPGVAVDSLFVSRDTANVGIRTTAPVTALDVNGIAKMTGFQLPTDAVPGRVLTSSDGRGAGVWKDLPLDTGGTVRSVATGSGLTGGPITTTGTIAIAANGVTSLQLAEDAGSLAKVSGHALVSSNGNIGIGIANPAHGLTVSTATSTGTGLPNGVSLGRDKTLNAHVELVSGGTPYIDFNNDNTSDFKARLILSDSNTLNLIAPRVQVNGSLVLTSDARFKTNVQPLSGALGDVLALNGVTFDWRTAQFPGRNFPAGRQVGFIAQDVEKVLPELVYTGSDGYKAVAYQNIVPVLVEAVKTLQAENDQLRAEKDAQIRTLEQRLERLERAGR